MYFKYLKLLTIKTLNMGLLCNLKFHASLSSGIKDNYFYLKQNKENYSIIKNLFNQGLCGLYRNKSTDIQCKEFTDPFLGQCFTKNKFSKALYTYIVTLLSTSSFDSL